MRRYREKLSVVSTVLLFLVLAGNGSAGEKVLCTSHGRVAVEAAVNGVCSPDAAAALSSAYAARDGADAFSPTAPCSPCIDFPVGISVAEHSRRPFRLQAPQAEAAAGTSLSPYFFPIAEVATKVAPFQTGRFPSPPETTFAALRGTVLLI